LWGNHENIKLTNVRQKRVEELEKRLKSMEEQLRRANEGKEVMRIADERDALDNLWEEGLSNFESRISLEGSGNPDVRRSREFRPTS
jgi:hypothetical protein